MTATAFKVEAETGNLQWDEELRQRFIAFKDRNDWTWDQVSRDLQRFYGKKRERGKGKSGRSASTGVGVSTIYAYSTLHWTASQEALTRFEDRVRGWLDHRQAGGKEADIDFTIEAAKLIQYGLDQAVISRKFVTVIGASGMGKTLLTRHYANARTKGGLVIVECYDGMTPRSFLAAVARALGEIDTGTVDHLITRVRGVMAEQPKLLAVDEANFLHPQSLNHLVHIHNTARTGIVLLGTEELQRIVVSSRLQRVASRMKISVIIGTLNADEIRARLEEIFDNKQVTARVIELARLGSMGRYRDLDTIIDTASDVLDKNPSKSLEAVMEQVSPRMRARKVK